MKILFTSENRVRHDSTGEYFYNAFCKVADVTRAFNEELKYINHEQFDLCVKIDDGLESHEFPAHFHPSVYYVIDTHIHPDWRLKLAKEANFDYIFCAQKRGSELDWHTKNVSWLPLACDPNVHGITGPRYKCHDICFIGNVQPFWQKRRIERLSKVFKEFPNFYFGNKFFKDATEKYSESKIVFNSAHSDDINMRVFEAMCSGSMLLTDKQDWQGLFEPGKHFVEYTDDDMIEKIKYYLENDVEREHIATHGQIEVIQNHKYIDRVKKILEICKGDS